MIFHFKNGVSFRVTSFDLISETKKQDKYFTVNENTGSPPRTPLATFPAETGSAYAGGRDNKPRAALSVLGVKPEESAPRHSAPTASFLTQGSERFITSSVREEPQAR